ncbi:lysine-rich arabinogalactan protein 19-like [Triticum dicoccoides]|uniref:lysine-rich arabinogalactan protein 19-like n=1 Tax=Triticum dicoccoides TaxID=85692 RepID=UPI00188E5312|nr:lysine-rich arabinogalactan protein 19-like [Triticum dicoccoides]
MVPRSLSPLPTTRAAAVPSEPQVSPFPPTTRVAALATPGAATAAPPLPASSHDAAAGPCHHVPPRPPSSAAAPPPVIPTSPLPTLVAFKCSIRRHAGCCRAAVVTMVR